MSRTATASTHEHRGPLVIRPSNSSSRRLRRRLGYDGAGDRREVSISTLSNEGGKLDRWDLFVVGAALGFAIPVLGGLIVITVMYFT